MKQFPKINSEIIYLDQITKDDIPLIVKYANNPNITNTTRTMPHPYFEEDAIAWIHSANEGFKASNNYLFAIRLKSTAAFLGGIGLTLDTKNNRAELGYWLAEEFWNNGFTSEAVAAILKYGFEQLQLNKIIAVYLTTNHASGKVMIKNRMIKEAEFKNHDVKKDKKIADNEYVSLVQYRLLKEEYEALKN